MSGYSVSTALGRVAATEADSIFLPRISRGGRGVVLAHGAGSSGEFLDATGQLSSVRLAAALATAGIPCITGVFGGDTWANSTGVSRVGVAASVLQAATGCASDKVCVLGVSMGGAVAVKYAQTNPSSVAAVYGIMPVSSIDSIYQSNAFGLRASVGTAWGVTYPAALPAGANLLTNASALAAVPGRLDYGTADTVIQSSTVTALAAAWGSACTATVTDTTHDHSDNIVAATDPATVVAFFITNGA